MPLSDEIYLRPTKQGTSTKNKTNQKLLLFFITGNPGLIEYYRSFLTRLYDLIRTDEAGIAHHVYGASLPGFEVSDGSPHPDSLSHTRTPPFTLQEQVDGVFERLVGTVKRLEGEDGSGPIQVVLIGHSVGAFMLLEVIARWQDASSFGARLDIVGGICLFPTVVDIAKSPTGKKAAPLFQIPYFALIVHLIAKLLTTFIPLFAFVRLVQLVTGMPTDGARTTAAFVKSKYGVWQALHMAKHELQEMTNDKWSDEVWGARGLVTATNATAIDHSTKKSLASVTTSTSDAKAGASRPVLYFYWGRDDHWIANSTRDAVMASRAKRAAEGGSAEQDGPFMEIAADEVPHAFCLRHSESVARKCAEYVEDIQLGL